jgi:multidrug resistance efflux pump
MARSLVRISYADLQSELRRRERASGSLVKRRDRLAAKLSALEAQIEQMGGSVIGRGRRGTGTRAKNDMTLTEGLTKAIGGKSMSVTDAAEAVQKLGYRTNSSNFRTQVNIALIKSGKFKRVGRGEYAAK